MRGVPLRSLCPALPLSKEWTLASIPAMIILVILGMLAAGIIAGMFGAIGGGG